MLRNNLVSFGIHFFVLALSGLLYSLSGHPVYLGFVVLLSFTMYVLLGHIFLKSMGTVALNILSVSAVSLIGALIGLYGWFFPSLMGFNRMIFLAYHSFTFALVQMFQISPAPALTFWFFVVPTLLLWTGLQLRKR
ncbi:hypothetical protein [Paenibacillus sp. MBLB4367]|uniref:hypothetical protein n=1 Tax=Paenibacillus sp. MBLB4367 TaxID=3384767 RepID=UPI003907F88D